MKQQRAVSDNKGKTRRVREGNKEKKLNLDLFMFAECKNLMRRFVWT